MPGKAAFEVGLVLGELWEAAGLPTQPWGYLLPTAEPGRESIAQRLPLGVVGVISPWNFPQIYAPTVLGSVTQSMPAFREETSQWNRRPGREAGRSVGPRLSLWQQRGPQAARGPAVGSVGPGRTG